MNIKDAIKSQYLASLAMLQEAVAKCPESLWQDREYANAFWHIAYHTLYYTHLYLQPTGEDFRPWSKHRGYYHSLTRQEPKSGEPYSQADILEYLEFCRMQVDQQVSQLDLEAESGFHWLPFDKLELQFYNIRHLQQHIGELCERLGAQGGVEVAWAVRG